MPFAPELRSHSQKVCTLYKKALRLIEGFYVYRPAIRYHQVILRNEFDCNRCVCDPKEQRRLLWLGEFEVFQKTNPIPPMKFPTSYGLAGGVAAERVVVKPDWILDYWHPLEKAQYPQYFARPEDEETPVAMDSTKTDGPSDKEVKKPMTDEERLALAKKMDDELDVFINSLERKRYTDGWSEDRWEEEMDKHPFFMKTVPEEGQMSPLVEGLAKLKYDPEENTPLELATNYKDDGNFQFKHKNYRMAIIAYTEGIKLKCNSDDLNATLYQNRSTAQFYLKNFRSSLLDSERALKFAPNYYKALFRAAKAAFQCLKYSQCIEHCQTILASKPQDKEVADLITKAKQKLVIQERDDRRKKRLHAIQSEQAELVVKAIKQRGIRVYEWIKKKNEDLDVNYEYSLLETKTSNSAPDEMVHIDNGVLHWPVLLIYPEYKVTDYINACPETRSLLSEIVQVFPAPWDDEEKYNLQNINVYFEGYNMKLVLINPNRLLSELLAEEFFHVKGGLASFIILARGSDAEKRFLKDYE